MHMITKRIGQMLKLRLLLKTLTPSKLNMKPISVSRLNSGLETILSVQPFLPPVY